MGGPPAFHMITVVNIDVIEQWWLTQFGLAAARGPHNVQLWPSLRMGAWGGPDGEGGGSSRGGGRKSNSQKSKVMKLSSLQLDVARTSRNRQTELAGPSLALGHIYRS